ncbi:hypothetical protein EVA_12277 [gut metagenome]|uniref:Uncharacterized protein n=1 Tax=gut metagenome TaxID=749906 RepID=J9FXB4_9ZZZZ
MTRSRVSSMPIPIFALTRGASRQGMPITSSTSWATRSGSELGRSILLRMGTSSRSCSTAM